MKKNIIGLRREDKNKWERRVPLTPAIVGEFQKNDGLSFVVQSSPIRIFKDEEYREAGAKVQPDLKGTDIVFAVKEIPIKLIEPKKVYVFFSHTIKGQAYNMPMLKKLLDSEATLVDYERIADDAGRRLVFFGPHAGYAGMIDCLHLLGKRHESLGKKCMFHRIKMAWQYHSLEEAKKEIRSLGDEIRTKGFPTPIVFGFAGYGNVSHGAQEILGQLPVVEISPDELLTLRERVTERSHCVYKVVFKEKDMAERIDGSPFDLQNYYDQPELFRSRFSQYIPLVNVLLNCIYWTDQYPRFVTKALLKDIFGSGGHKPEIIGDISIDINGAIECSYKSTHSDNPTYVFEPLEDRYVDGVVGRGPVILAVDNLPCELPRESSETFSKSLKSFVPAMAKADWKVDFELLDLPAPIKSAIVAHKGKLTPDYEYLAEYLALACKR